MAEVTTTSPFSSTQDDLLIQHSSSSDTSQSFSQILCQEPEANEEEEIERQQQAARDLEKAVVGLEIAQGAIEITLGAIRIAAAGTTAEVLRREDAIAQSRASNRPSESGTGVPTEPPNEPILSSRKDSPIDSSMRKNCAPNGSSGQLSDNPYSQWNTGFHLRMKRSNMFRPLYTEQMHNFVRPTLDPKTENGYPFKLPNTDEAEHLLNLLENLLNTNNQVLLLLGIELPPLTTSHVTNPGALLLKQYRQRLERRKEMQRRYGKQGYLEEQEDEDDLDMVRKWRTPGHRGHMHALTGELAQLQRTRRRLGPRK